MSEPTNRELNIYISTGNAQAALDVLKKKEAELKKSLAEATDPRVVAKLNAELKKLEVPIDNANKKLKGQLSPTLKDLNKTVDQLSRELKNLSREDPGFAKKVLQFRQAQLELTKAKNEALAFNNSLNQGARGSGIAGRASSIGTGLLQGFGIGVGITALQQIPALISSSIDEFLQAEQAVSRLQNKLNNLGRGDVFDRIINKAQAIADKFKFIDNDDIIGVFDQLITYGKLTEKQMDQLLPVIVDFASDARIGLDEATKVIIAGMEGQGKALKQYGINIKDAKTQTERFNIIATTLKEKVEGAADAFGNSLAGNIAASQQRVKDLQEEIGKNLLPIKVRLLNFVNEVSIGFVKLAKSIRLAVSAGIDFRQADDFMRSLEVSEKFGKEQSEKELDPLKSLSVAEQTSELIKLNAEKERLDKLVNDNKASIRNRNGAIVEKAELDFVLSRRVVLERLIPALKALMKEQETANEVLGVNQDDPPEKNKGAKKAEEERKRLLEALKQKSFELSLYGNSQFTKDIKNVLAFYEKLRETANGNSELIVQIDELQKKELGQIADKYRKEDDEKAKKFTEEQANARKELEKKRLQALVEFSELLAKDAAATADRQIGGRKFRIEVDELIGNQKQKLSAKIEGLELERDIEIANAEKTGKAIYDIQSKYDYLIKQAKRDSLEEQREMYIGFVSQVSSALGEFFSFQNSQEEGELETLSKKSEKEKKALEQQLDSQLISRKEYNRKIAESDRELQKKENELRRKQFYRDKIESGLRVSINIAEGISKALTNPTTAGFVIPFIATLGAIQLGLIAAKKFPEYSKGGKLKGPLHSQGGMPVINPRTGQKEAEVEGGEVILSRNTVRNNTRLVNELLDSSMNRNGARINSLYRNGGVLPSINYAQASQSLQRVTRYASGGSFASTSTNSSHMEDTLSNLTIVVSGLKEKLDDGIVAYASIQQFNLEQKRLDDIKRDVTMK